MDDSMENYRTTTFGTWHKPLLTFNWITERTKYKTKENEDYFEQIVLDAVSALNAKTNKTLRTDIIYVFTQEQVDAVIKLAKFTVNVEQIDFYFILTKGEK